MDYKKVYNENYFNGKNSFFWKLGYGNFSRFYFNNMFRNIRKYVPKNHGRTVLDVGCAYGFMLQKLPDSYKKFRIDISQHAISVAKKRLPGATLKICGAEDQLAFQQDFFDIILLNDVLEHLKFPKIALKNIQKLLKKDGILYITTPNLNLMRKKIYRYADKKEHHVSLFPHLELKSTLDSLGFRIMDHWTFLNFFAYLKFESNIGPESAFICKKIN